MFVLDTLISYLISNKMIDPINLLFITIRSLEVLMHYSRDSKDRRVIISNSGTLVYLQTLSTSLVCESIKSRRHAVLRRYAVLSAGRGACGKKWVPLSIRLCLKRERSHVLFPSAISR